VHKKKPNDGKPDIRQFHSRSLKSVFVKGFLSFLNITTIPDPPVVATDAFLNL